MPNETYYYATGSEVTSIADAIRAKTGGSSQLEFPDGFVSAIGQISGGSETIVKKDVNFIDYDGTLVASKTKTEVNAMTSDSDLPANPTHTGLTAQGWNWTVAQLKAQLTAMPDQPIYVGQMYVTTSGATEIDVEFADAARLSPILTICVNGEVSVDWGDGTTPDTVTGSSLSTKKAVGPHNYASAGKYTISITVVSGKFNFTNSSDYLLLRKNTTNTDSRVYANCIRSIRLGSGITSINDYAFYYCGSLSSISIPSSITIIGNYVFYYCYSLSSISIPSEVTMIGNSAFYICYSLSSISIPSGVTTIGTSAFYCCYSMHTISIPSGVTTIGSSMIQNCYELSRISMPSGITSISANALSYCCSLSSITIPSGVTSIGNTAFQNCYGMKEYHFKSTTVPSAGTTIFRNIVSDCIIYVPRSENQAVLNAYKAAENWSDYASYMQEEPES